MGTVETTSPQVAQIALAAALVLRQGTVERKTATTIAGTTPVPILSAAYQAIKDTSGRIVIRTPEEITTVEAVVAAVDFQAAAIVVEEAIILPGTPVAQVAGATTAVSLTT